MSDNDSFKQTWPRLALVSCVVATAGLVAHSHFFQMDALIALRGWSAIDFTNSVLYPENFARDYPGGARHIGKSLLPWIYPLAAQLGLSPETAIYPMIWLEIVALVLGATFLFSSLFPGQGPTALVCVATLFVFNWGHFVNLANFGAPFFIGQYYGFADGLRLLIIALVIRQRFALATAALGLCFTFHPIKALIAGVFAAPAALAGSSRPVLARLLVCGFTFAVFATIWSVFWIGLGGAGNEHIETEEFIAYARLLNSHWFPQDLGILGSQHERFLTPFLSFCVFSVIALARSPLEAAVKRKLTWGLAALLIVTATGLGASLTLLDPTLIKLNLQRATALIVSVGSLVIVGNIVTGIRDAKWLTVSVEAVFLSTGFWTLQPFPELLTACYFALYLSSGAPGPSTGLLRSMVFALVGLLAAKATAFWLAAEPGGYTPLSGWRELGVALLLAATLVALSRTAVRAHGLEDARTGVALALLGMAFTVQAALWSTKFKRLDASFLTNGHAYKAVQVWARDQSTPESLFMADPCIGYGWRDYSQRSSFGSFSEWLKTAWLYSGDARLLREGKRRAAALGIDVSPYLGRSAASFYELCAQATARYYDPTGTTLDALADTFGIDYFVLDWSKVPETGLPPEFAVAFSNTRYVVLQPPPGE